MNKTTVTAFAALAMLAALPVQAGNHCDTTQVDVHIKPNELKVTPAAPRCVVPGTTFTIRVKPPGAGAGRVITVEEKEGVPLDIDGNNESDPNEVLVHVSGNGNPAETYGYIIRVSGHGMLDPEVRVVSSRLLMLTSEIEQANAVLEEQMGFGVNELIKKKAEQDEAAKQAE